MHKRQMKEDSFAYKHLQEKGWSEGEKHATAPLSSLHSSLLADSLIIKILSQADFIMLLFIFLVVPSIVVSSTR